MAEKDIIKDKVEKKTLQAKNKAKTLGEKTSKKEDQVEVKAGEMKEDVKQRHQKLKNLHLKKNRIWRIWPLKLKKVL